MSARGGETGRADFIAEYAAGAEEAKRAVCNLGRIRAEWLGEE
jgi:hypothetical protein